MADRGRGGYQAPQRPAAVSNPGSGARTDGGAGSSRQPVRVATGGAYGQTKAATEQQQAAPLPDASVTGAAPSSGGGSPGGGGGVPAGGAGGVFGPTQRPNEPNNAQPSPQQVNPAAASPQAALRVMYAKFPHPAIARLLDHSTGGGTAE